MAYWALPDAEDERVNGRPPWAKVPLVMVTRNRCCSGRDLVAMEWQPLCRYVTPASHAIDDLFVKVNSEDLRLYKMRLKYSLRCLQFLLHQGLAFRGHDESEQSSNRGNFLELLKWLAANSEEVNKYVLKNAPGNCQLTSHQIQHQIIQCCAQLTRKKMLREHFLP